MSLTVHSMGSVFINGPELGGPNLVNINLPKSRIAGWLESDMGYKR